jgi:uncharacterized protein (TIGR03437 family)
MGVYGFLMGLAVAGSLCAAPPGATVRTQIPGMSRYLNVPPGFQISLFANVSGARFLAVAPNGDVLVSQPGAGRITLLRPNPTGGAPASFAYATGLNNAQGMAFRTIGDTTYLYVSEASQVVRFVYVSGDTKARDKEVIVPGLPAGGSHPLKNIAFDADGKLYVALGSSCNVCTSDTTSSPKRGAIYVYNADGSGGRLFAQGLRNAEGLAVVPGTNRLWAVVNSRDDVPYPLQDDSTNYGRVFAAFVDDNPPDLFTSVRDGGNYGWPFCNSLLSHWFDGSNLVPDFDTNRDQHVNCAALDNSDKGIPAHSAPLGLSMLHGTGFAAPYRNGAAIGLHGSWDRSVPTGYKVVWYPVADRAGEAVDLVTGWLDPATNRYWGRPVAAVPDSTGGLLISDDAAGAVYRLSYAPGAISAASGYALVAPESLASIYGENLSAQTVSASSTTWPTSLGGVTVTVQDAAGTSRAAPLAYVSTHQVNFLVPAGTAPGNATLSVQTPSGPLNAGSVTVARVAPSLFSANGNGAGVAAATAVQLELPLMVQTPVTVYQCASAVLGCLPVPILIGERPIWVSFFGTGIRGLSAMSNVQVTIGGVSAPLSYAGSQRTFPGLDQVNIQLPLELRGAGLVDVVLTVDGVTSNPVQLAIQ